MIQQIFNTGETQADLRAKYNPDGSLLRKAQLRMLDILIEFDRICKKHDIEYWLEFGTLLGAARHGGFIPWDDDLDVNVRHKDFQKLMKILPQELSEQFCLQHKSTLDFYPLMFAKIKDKKSKSIEGRKSFYGKIPKDINKEKTVDNGCFIDIFSAEKIPSVFWKKIIDPIYRQAFKRKQHYYTGTFKYLTGVIAYPFVVALVETLRFFFKFSRSNKLINSFGVAYFNKVHTTDEVFPCKPILFEGHEFLAPANVDAYLRAIYGDYTQLPPEEKREVHFIEITFLD